MKLFSIKFLSTHSTPRVLIVKADNKRQAYQLACKTITHTTISIQNVVEIKLENTPQILFSGVSVNVND